MKTTHHRVVVGMLSVFLLGGCVGSSGGDEDRSETSEVRNEEDRDRDRSRERDSETSESPTLEDLGNAMQDLGAALSADADVEPVDHRELKNDVLPEDLPGMTRISSSSERTGMFGINIATAEADYEADDNDDPARITITITDLGTIKSAAMLGYGWLMAEVDRESDDGYERTRTYKDYPAHEEFSRHGDTGNGEIQVIVADRFVVGVEGRGIKNMEPVLDALDEVSFRRLRKRAE